MDSQEDRRVSQPTMALVGEAITFLWKLGQVTGLCILLRTGPAQMQIVEGCFSVV